MVFFGSGSGGWSRGVLGALGTPLLDCLFEFAQFPAERFQFFRAGGRLAVAGAWRRGPVKAGLAQAIGEAFEVAGGSHHAGLMEVLDGLFNVMEPAFPIRTV